MKDILDLILNLGLIIFVAYTACLGVKSRVQKANRTKEELRKEGKLLPPKKALINLVKTLGGMFGSAVFIAAIVFYIIKVKFLLSPFVGMVLFVIMIECIIGTLWGFAQDVIKTYKEDGALGTIVPLIMTIIWAIAFVYVKYYI